MTVPSRCLIKYFVLRSPSLQCIWVGRIPAIHFPTDISKCSNFSNATILGLGNYRTPGQWSSWLQKWDPRPGPGQSVHPKMVQSEGTSRLLWRTPCLKLTKPFLQTFHLYKSIHYSLFKPVSGRISSPRWILAYTLEW